MQMCEHTDYTFEQFTTMIKKIQKTVGLNNKIVHLSPLVLDPQVETLCFAKFHYYKHPDSKDKAIPSEELVTTLELMIKYHPIEVENVTVLGGV